ncbi:MAG: AgmX/PglI C-terminal domain-containing protein [Myxococcales bacterium]|nr:AgmX/PglI C-terminal domain-containing protein [Myxococcales bacterium]
MRARIALAVVLALAACKSKSEDARSSEVSSGRPTQIGTAAGSGSDGSPPGAITGSDPAHGHATGSGSGSPRTGDPTAPAVNTAIARTDQGALQPIGQAPPVVTADKPAITTAPASPTRIEDTQALGAQQAPSERDVAYGGELQRAGGITPPAVAPRGRIALARTQLPDVTSLTAEAVAAKIKAAYLPGLERCYRQRLANDPTARGPLALSFVVTALGRVTGANSTAFHDSVGTCAQTVAATWRFPAPKDPNTRAAIAAHVVLGFVLVPE